MLHAMYEDPALPGTVTYDEVAHAERTAGQDQPSCVPMLDEILAEATAVGRGAGWADPPPPGSCRLHWRELGERIGHDPFVSEWPPSSRSWPYASWPIAIQPPTEGSLGPDEYAALLELLADHSPQGPGTICMAFWGEATAYDTPDDSSAEHVALYETTLEELADSYGSDVARASPSNIWPLDRTWIIATDWDLWATKLSAPPALVHAAHTSDTLETVELPF